MSIDTDKILVDKLKSFNASEVYDALLKIRKIYARNAEKMKKLEKYSVIKLIIPCMEHPKFCNISLSIIGDGCLDSNFANEVIKCDGIKSLVRILGSFVNEDIKNRACRALGNIAKFETGFKAIHLLKPVFSIINFLSETSNANCQQTAVRTLMKLAKDAKTKELILQYNGFSHITQLLHSPDAQVLACSVKAVSILTKNCSISCARQLLEMQGHEVLVKLYAHSEKSVRLHALISLTNLSSLEEIRSGLVKVGAVKLFTEAIIACESLESSVCATLALCKCLDHMHMWSHNGTDRSVGLKALLTVLKSKRLRSMQTHVVASLIPFTYDSCVADILINLDIIPILIEILKCFIEKRKCKAKSPFISCSGGNKSVHEGDTYSENYENNLKKSLCPVELQNDNLLKNVHNRENVFHRLSPATSDYSSLGSPYQMYSPVQQTSPKTDFEGDVGSPSTSRSSGVWSPIAFIDEKSNQNISCWSPVASTHLSSSTSAEELELFDFDAKEQINNGSFVSFSKISCIPETDNGTNNPQDFLNCNASPLLKYETFEKKQVLDLKIRNYTKDDSDSYSEMQVLKKMKLDKLPKDEDAGFVPQTSIKTDDGVKNVLTGIKHAADKTQDILGMKSFGEENLPKCCETAAKSTTLKSDILNKDDSAMLDLPTSRNSTITVAQNKQCNLCDSKEHSNLKLQKEAVTKRTIDHYVVFLILQLSYHLEKQRNFQIVDKSCFSVLIDYICLVHNPSLKAKTILVNLVRNRYCFEKLILNGFVSEIEEKMSTPSFSCDYHSCVQQIYCDLINILKQEVRTDYGIGTLSRILVTSDKNCQVSVICAASNLLTEKSLLYKILIKAPGLTLLLSLLSDCDITIQRTAVLCLCKIYQSLPRKQKTYCFGSTCRLKTSSECFYRKSYLNVTFTVRGGAKILANREKICDKSEYFRALLKGHFRETDTQSVFLPDICAENLTIIFHFLHGCCGSETCCPHITVIPALVLLELLSDCEKLLLFNIKAFIEDSLYHRMSPPLVPKIYVQSKMHNSPALTQRSMEYFLQMDVSQKDLIWNCFQELKDMECNADFVSDLESIFRNLLQ